MISIQQTESLKEFLRAERLTDESLIDDLVDHLSCEIESRLEIEQISFEEAFEQAKQKTLPNEPLQVQKDLEFLTTKTQNIMIKKIAFIGGYFSVVCLCLSILFFGQSLLGSKKSQLKIKAVEVEFQQANRTLSNQKQRDEFNNKMTDLYTMNILQSSKKFEQAELFFIIAVALFIGSYLPYRFYAGFQKSQLELT